MVRLRRASGFSLIEVMIVVAITGVLLAMGLSAFRTTVATNRTRLVAESVMSGLQLARAEAIRRNAPMRFQLVNDFTSGCTESSTSALWIVSQTDQALRGLMANKCDSLPFIPPDQLDPCNPDAGICPASGAKPANCRPIGNPALCADDPWVAFKSGSTSPAEVSVAGRTATTGTTAASLITFGPLGQVLTNIGGTVTLGYVLVSHATDGDAKTWAIRINTTNGGIKFCDPALVAGAPMACS